MRSRRADRPEHQLMRSFATGDGAAAERLYDLYSSRIYGLGLVMLGNEAAAEDLVQDTMVKVRESLETKHALGGRARAPRRARPRFAHRRRRHGGSRAPAGLHGVPAGASRARGGRQYVRAGRAPGRPPGGTQGTRSFDAR